MAARDDLLRIVNDLKNYIQEETEARGACAVLCLKGVDESVESMIEDPQSSKSNVIIPKMTLRDIREELGDCQRCNLCSTRNNIVFGEGHENARLVFVGEAPGGEEDKQGRPFVGRAGQLLTRIVEAMGLSRKDVYICNILKCRPPQNRNPRPEEIQVCEPFLIKQLEAIQPTVICALGTFAAKTLLKKDVPISQLRGRFHAYQGIQLMPTYHPAYLLRNPGAKKQVWQDVQMIMELLK